ncbi:unnamed protein product [Sordaria macrospora k-hell]|uniref:WGS project CABT00000000 data, contig 2.14 n=2 Tax=Sordaria macrospora TaxID=5147 RepID=F7VYR5_SORMK|nr:uncharacterized protein SMAC_04501 [Sordaria macrospora k-hell]KAH7633652.1 hypothetical protein B0T09DRAFT_256415 [Sordaria sp. MPI-SDFR-AT-0083]CCC10660.1 unnamed protein product [Sordaria macrospora k-hell]
MDIDLPTTTTTTTTTSVTKSSKSQTLSQTTIRSPPFSYAHLSLVSPSPPPSLDALTARQYLTSSLRQFLGDTGASMAMAIDILLVKGGECWVRVPREDLAGFAAAVTAYPGHQVGGEQVLMRVVGCGDWLGALVGREGEGEVWG